jgi:uncharacterized membrane protein YraQ (UPF0718 family)
MADEDTNARHGRARSIASQVRDSLLDRYFLAFVALALAAGAATWHWKGEAAFDRAIAEAGAFALFILPRMAAALLIAAFLQALIPREVISRLIGEKAGLRGILIATVAGAATPGGPLTAFPIVVALFATGANKGALIAYLSAWAMFGFQRILVWEYPLMGGEFTLLRVTASLFLPVIAGMIALRLPWDIRPPAAPRNGGKG